MRSNSHISRALPYWLGLVGVVGSLTPVACAGSDDEAVRAQDGDAVEVGPEGKTMTVRGVSLVIPPHALSSKVVIRVTDDGTAPNAYAVSGKVYQFSPRGLHFEVPISVTFPRDAAKEETAFWTRDGSDDTYEPTETALDARGATVQITHFSSGFVGTSASGITCVVKRAARGCTTTTTVESPTFTFVRAPGSDVDDSAIATNSAGLSALFMMPAGSALLHANPEHTSYRTAAMYGANQAIADVDANTITSFRASGVRGVSAERCPQPIDEIRVGCTGGNVRLTNSPVPPARDAGSDSAITSDAGEPSSDAGGDASLTDAGTADASAPADAGDASADAGVQPTGPVAEISASGGRTCAVTTSGGVKCWGNNSMFGLLGNNTTANSSTPVSVTGLATGVAAVTTSGSVACARLLDGTAKCWGVTNHRQLGNGSTTQGLVPVGVAGFSQQPIASIYPGGSHACAFTTAGVVKCWGYDKEGRQGNGLFNVESDTVVATTVAAFPGKAIAMGAGADHTCALRDDGKAYCWGMNNASVLGTGNGLPGLTPTAPLQVAGMPPFVALGVGGISCAIGNDGSVWCWGTAIAGGTTTPAIVPTLTSGVARISVGGSHACAITTNGALKCWGYNTNGALGNGNTVTQTTPVDVPGYASGTVSVACGSNYTCAVGADGHAKCWGSNAYGQLGNGTTTNSLTPVDVIGL